MLAARHRTYKFCPLKSNLFRIFADESRAIRITFRPEINEFYLESENQDGIGIIGHERLGKFSSQLNW